MHKRYAAWLLCMTFAGLAGCSQSAAIQPAVPHHSQQQAAVALPGLQAGESLPWRELTAIDGKPVLLQNGQRQLLIFFATWCSDSQRAMRQLMASALVSQPDLQIVGIGREEDAAALTAFARVYQLNFALVADPDRALFRQVAEKGIPQLVTVNPAGQVQQVLLGEVPDAISLLHW